jgi:(R,R)-butanediol dehydrogenase / meso-butanediol dehydrogenase / diacetyl reductase
VIEPLRVCGTCRACRMGAAYLCYNLKVLGVEVPGGMQEYWAVTPRAAFEDPRGVERRSRGADRAAGRGHA